MQILYILLLIVIFWVVRKRWNLQENYLSRLEYAPFEQPTRLTSQRVVTHKYPGDLPLEFSYHQKVAEAWPFRLQHYI
jgi:hypothetical protein